MYKNINGLEGLFLSGKALFWATVFTFIGVFFYLFSNICSSFAIGFFLAYICAPSANILSKYVNRGLVSFVFTIAVVAFFIIIIMNVFPLLADYFTMISNNAPAYYQRSLELILQLCDSLAIPQVRDEIQNLRFDILKYIGQKMYIFSSLVRGIALQCTAFTEFMSSIFIAIVSFFYFLKDWNFLKQRCYNYVPRRQKEILKEIGQLIRRTFHSFFRGQFYVVSILSAFYISGLWLIGIKNFVMLGIMSGLFSFIPFVGALLSLVIAIFISATSLTIVKLYCIVVMYLLGQLVEGYILSPRFVGSKTGLHSLWILFSFFAGYQLKGIIGIIIAIPFTAVVNNLVIFALDKFRESQTYKQ